MAHFIYVIIARKIMEKVKQNGRCAEITRDEVSTLLNQSLQNLVDTMINKDKGNEQ